MKLYFKRLKHGNSGGGDHQKFRSDMILAGIYIKNKFGGSFEGNQQQHTGENWTVYGEGSPNGWSIKAPNASSNGYNRNFDISGINWSGKGMGGTYLKTYFGKNSEIVRFHNVIKGLNKGKSAYDKSGISFSNKGTNRSDSTCVYGCDNPHDSLPYNVYDQHGNKIDYVNPKNK